jgi:hypothetical protein
MTSLHAVCQRTCGRLLFSTPKQTHPSSTLGLQLSRKASLGLPLAPHAPHERLTFKAALNVV